MSGNLGQPGQQTYAYMDAATNLPVAPNLSNGAVPVSVANAVSASIPNAYPSFTSATVTALANVARITTDGRQRIDVEVQVTVAALSQFQILGRVSSSGTDQLLYSTSADYTVPKGLLIGTSGDLTVQAVGSGFFQMDCAGFESILIKAAGTASVIQLYAGLQ